MCHDVAERRFLSPAASTTPLPGIQVGAVLDASLEAELHERGGIGRGEACGCVVRVDDDDVARPLVAHDRLLGGPVASEVAVELEVVGPERDHGRDGRAVSG